MSKNLLEEICENCVWWEGDSSGQQGRCSKQEDQLTNRTDDCVVDYLARDVPYEFD
tara:strand:- start:6856 stop:7023 length:168 start_codon:yes stop_codon:yes gene_type:complete